jgi:hypothetical protein
VPLRESVLPASEFCRKLVTPAPINRPHGRSDFAKRVSPIYGPNTRELDVAGSLPSGQNLQPAASSSLLIFMRAAASLTISLTPLSNEEAQKHSCVFLLALFEVGRFNLPPGAVSDVDHPHRLPPFIYFINDPIDMRLIAVKQVPQLPLCLPGFRGNWAAQRK